MATSNSIPLHKLFDRRVEYEPLFESGIENIQIGVDGITPVIPVEDVNRIIIENDQLRETLFTEQNSLHQRLYDVINRTQQATIKSVTNNVTHISTYIKGALTEQQIYTLIYDLILPFDFANFQESGESIIMTCWKLGYLPIMAAHLKILENLVQRFVSAGGSKTNDMFFEISNKLSTRAKKSQQRGSQLSKYRMKTS